MHLQQQKQQHDAARQGVEEEAADGVPMMHLPMAIVDDILARLSPNTAHLTVRRLSRRHRYMPATSAADDHWRQDDPVAAAMMSRLLPASQQHKASRQACDIHRRGGYIPMWAVQERWRAVEQRSGCGCAADRQASLLALVVGCGCLGGAVWLRSQGCAMQHDPVLLAAARGGHVELLQWAVDEEGCRLEAAAPMAAPGHTSSCGEGGGWNGGARLCTAAAAAGHFAALKWLIARGAAANDITCAQAAAGGHLEVLQWLRQEAGCSWDHWTCTQVRKS